MGIKDIPDTLEGLATWSKVRFAPPSIVLAQREEQAYEETYMAPADTNKEVAGYSVEELLSSVPETFGLKAFCERIVICLMDDIVRESTSCVLHISKYCSNHLILSSWQIPQTAMVPPQVYRRLSGTSRFHSAVVSASTFPSKIPNNDQAPQS